MSQRYDIAVIGTGPAGVSAAITATVRNRSVLLLGSPDLSPKMTRAHLVRNYPGLPDISGADLAAALKAHLDALSIGIIDRKVTAVYGMGDYYAIMSGDEMFEATSVILATGVVPGTTLPGEDALLGRGVSYCATCDAALYRGKKTAVIAYADSEEREADFLAEIAGAVLYFPMYRNIVSLSPSVQVVRDRPVSIGQEDGMRVITGSSGEKYAVDGVFILRESISPSQLVPGLANDGKNVEVRSRRLETNLPGLFVAGDAAGAPYQYVKAAGEGNVAALSAVEYVDGLRRASAAKA